VATYTYTQLVELWEAAGGAPRLAGTMAAIALAESGGDPEALNPPDCRFEASECVPCNKSTSGDYSVGLWQINYYGGNFAPWKARYGCPYKLFDPLANARAAVDLAGGGSGLGNWTTYTSGAYRDHLPAPGAAAASGGSSAPSSGPRVEVRAARADGLDGRAETLPEAWHHFVHALGVTVPTRVKWANYASRRMKRAIR
jgi:hypothetical protein